MNEISQEKMQTALREWAQWNEKINVVSRKDMENLREHHVMHSLAIAEYLSRTGRGDLRGAEILDLGCGGGFPGIPLALAMPSCRFTLCDSIGKKVKVASAVAEALQLENVVCVNDRAENLKGPFDYVVSRAVATLSDFYPWVKGKFSQSILCLKGGDIEQEIDAFCRDRGVKKELVSVWPVSEWLKDEYFSEKYVVEIKRS